MERTSSSTLGPLQQRGHGDQNAKRRFEFVDQTHGHQRVEAKFTERSARIDRNSEAQ